MLHFAVTIFTFQKACTVDEANLKKKKIIIHQSVDLIITSSKT